jgi:hypothetical protein
MEYPPTPKVESTRKAPWLSRKWWAMMIGVIAALVTHFTGLELDTETLVAIIAPIVAYILGESFIDSRK